ncbi:molybdenum cofactor guanylyltransferase [Candidatus Desantisbacteria bacterium]|nr:molybdenum cofactor guanylyltransferase [Candidatus Desantisbacteria bacterium]
MYPLNAIILAGGQSSRFGSDKAEMVIEGQGVLEALINKLRGVCRQIIVVSNAGSITSQIRSNRVSRGQNEKRKQVSFRTPNRYPDVKVVGDVLCGIGPLGGIHAGLLASDTQHNLVLACDMPFINIEFVKYILSQIKPDDMALIPMIHNRAEPLCGIYARGCISVIEGLNTGTKAQLNPLPIPLSLGEGEKRHCRTLSPSLSHEERERGTKDSNVLEGLTDINTAEFQRKKAREFCILQLLDRIGTRYIEEEIIRQFDPQLHMFFNINTLQDMKQAEKMHLDSQDAMGQ